MDAAWWRVAALCCVCGCAGAKSYPGFCRVAPRAALAVCRCVSLRVRCDAPAFPCGCAVVCAGWVWLRFLAGALCCACVSLRVRCGSPLCFSTLPSFAALPPVALRAPLWLRFYARVFSQRCRISSVRFFGNACNSCKVHLSNFLSLRLLLPLCADFT